MSDQYLIYLLWYVISEFIMWTRLNKDLGIG